MNEASWTALALLLLAAPLADAQTAGTTPRIGFLRTTAPPDSYVEAFRQGLKERGYVEGKNIAFEYRWAGGTARRLPELAGELVRLKVDVIVTDGTPPARAAQKASTTIPIVMASSGDPVGTGLVASLARPAGNITGLTSINAELGSQLLDVLKEVVPNLTHLYVDKILKGARPADLPVEQPTKFDMIINLKAAKQIALRIPPAVLARADHIIE